jgi:hypothetical protein
MATIEKALTSQPQGHHLTRLPFSGCSGLPGSRRPFAKNVTGACALRIILPALWPSRSAKAARRRKPKNAAIPRKDAALASTSLRFE